MSAVADRHKRDFEQDPSNTTAFDALEEHFFMTCEWDQLAALYSRRVEAPEFADAPERTLPILFRLAQVCEERCLDIDGAIENYWKVAKIEPTYRPALRQLRQIYTQRSQWDLVLQIAEMEGQLPMEERERANFLAELGDIWNGRLNDPSEAMAQYQAALEIVPDHMAALKGLARVHTGLGHHQQAASAWERLANRLRGPDRAPVLVALGSILGNQLDEVERAMDCFKRALEDDPRCASAVEALLVFAAAREEWPLVAKLNERRYDIAAGARKRAAISVEAGRLSLERLDDVQGARMWFDRALEMVDEDVTVFEAIADLERRTGNRRALADALARVIRMRGDSTPTSTLLEAADLHSEAGNEEKAVELLTQALDRAPDDALVAETLSDGLARLGRTEELVEILERRAALAGDDPQAEGELRAEIGRIQLEDLGDTEAAISSLDRAFELDPQMNGVASDLERLHRKREDWQALRSLLERACVEGPVSRRAHHHAALGEVRERHFDDPDGAMSAYETALEADAECQLAHEGISRIVRASGEPEALLRVCLREAAITSDRARLAELVWQMVPLLEERDRAEEALGWVERLAELVPDDRQALEAIVRLREFLGRGDQTQDPLERLERLLTGVDQMANRRKLAALHAAAGDAEQAITWFESALEGDPLHVESLRSLKALYRETRNFEALAQTTRNLAEALPAEEQTAELADLAELLVDQLGDVEGAIVILWRLVKLPEAQRPAGIDERLEDLLDRAGRFEQLAQQLTERRRTLADESDEARQLDLRRANLLLDNLGQYEQAAELFARLRASQPDDEVALEGLERSLRLGNDAEGLVDLLGELADRQNDANARAELEFERATLLEETLGAFDEAREALVDLAERLETPEIAARAGDRLERLYTRSGEWSALRARLEGRIGRGSQEDDLSLHEELARLCRDRMGDRDGCVEHLEKAGRIAPESQTIWQSLALLYSELDRPFELLRVIENELGLDPDRERETMLRARAARLASELPHAASRCSEHYERLLALEPGHPEASEYLLDYYEREDQPANMVRLLRARLEATLAQNDRSIAATSRVISLRLRIAALESQRLDNDEAAVAVLAPAIDEVGPRAEVARPLADLYRRLERHEHFVSLCERAAQQCGVPDERATWLLEVGDTLRQQGLSERAVGAYRGVLEARPQDLDAESALRELYRELGEAAPLADLLKREVTRHSGAAAIPVRLELARLLVDPLGDDESALQHFAAILAEDPGHHEAYIQSVDLTRRLERFGETRDLLDRGLAATDAPTDRAALLEQLADLEAGPLEDPEMAVLRYREALSLDPSRSRIRARLAETLESLGRFRELLDCLFLEAQQASAEERSDIYQRAIDIARREISSDAALPWLERLHAERPDDPEILSRIAEIHREAGRPEALLRALQAQLLLRSDPAELHAVQRDMAGVLERDLDAPGRAALALEAAHALDVDDAGELADLDRLYESLGRHADRARILDARIACEATAAAELPQLHRSAARLWQQELCSPETATRHWLHSIQLSETTSPDLMELLHRLQQCLRSTGRLDGWSRAAERELELLTARRDPAGDERRYALRSELADCYEHELARPMLAQRHLLALLDQWDGAAELMPAQIDKAEAALIHHLRRERNHVELERRLTVRLDRLDGDAAEWLELAKLEQERLHRPSAARRAFLEVLERDAECLEAIRGLRDTAERLGDFERVAESLERELALAEAPAQDEAVAYLRRLAEIARTRLSGEDAPERAVRAYREILERVPDDLESVRALQAVEEGRGGWNAAIQYYELEVSLLGDDDAAHRRELWLRIAEIARDKNDEPARSIRAFESADEALELPLPRIREWAELHRLQEEWDDFAEVFSRWCDAPQTPAGCSDLLVLSEVLHDLGQANEAIDRAEMAIEADPSRAAAWERAAALREAHGDAERAADQLAEAAELRDAGKAVEHLLHAAQLVFEDEIQRAAELLRRATDYDSACAEAHARLAIACERLERWEEAESAAARAIDLCPGSDGLEEGLLLQAALSGARAAWQRGALESAIRLFSTVRELDPENIEALDALGELLYASHDLPAARDVIDVRLAKPGPNANAARQHAIVGEALELEEAFDHAIESFERAREEDPALDQAYAGIVRIHARNEDPAKALEAIDAWIEVQQDDVVRSDALLQAARLEQSIEETAAAIARLREASKANPANAGAWTMLSDLLLRLEQPDEALEAATSGLAVIDSEDRESVATLAFVRARTLEAGGELADAAAAYGLAVENDPSQAEAVLAQARLLRDRGDWQQAANGLASFLENHPEPNEPTLARVAYERGQLMAGPLEDVEEAIRCYQHAVELDPDFTRAVEPLANLLSYMPERWEQAVRQHTTLLRQDPARESSIRSLMTICERRGDASGNQAGFAILRALGCTTSEEFDEAPGRLGFAVGLNPQLADPHAERMRKLLVSTSAEVSDALASRRSSDDTEQTAPSTPGERAFWNAMRTAEAELSLPDFARLSAESIGQAIEQVAALAWDRPRSELDRDIVEFLERSIGRWARRKLRKAVEGTDAADLANIEWEGWCASLRGVASAIALDRQNGELRSALLALSTDPEDACAEPLPETSDITDRVRNCPAASELLRHVIDAWSTRISRR